MTRLSLALLAFALAAPAPLLLAGCIPAPVYVAPTLPVMRQIGAQEAAVIVFDATSTAASMATANAISTDTRQRTQEAAADGWTATAQTLALQGTRDAATAQARETQVAATWTAAAVERQATTTGWAVRAEITLTAVSARATGEGQLAAATERVGEALAAERRRIGWDALPYVLMALAAVLGVAFWWEWRRALRARTDAQVWRLRMLDMSAGTVFGPPGETPMVLPAARVLENPDWKPEPADTADPNEARLGQWRVRLIAFAFQGNLVGFTLRAMTEAGVVSDPAWRAYTKLLTGAGVLGPGKSGGTTWTEGWHYYRLRAELSNGVLTLPFPEGDAPPVFAGKSHNPHTTHTGNTEVGEG